MMKYVVVYQQSSAGWSAYVPDLPGCVATGATRKEVERNIRQAIAFHLEGMRLEGLPIPGQAPGGRRWKFQRDGRVSAPAKGPDAEGWQG
jgi:predicted RNase H-like HicB family nuclease